MDILPFTPVDFVAIDRTRNIHRRWSLVARRDLFGQVVVETNWGRIGRRGQHLVKSFADEAAALRYARAVIARRRSAKRRLGVGYVTRDCPIVVPPMIVPPANGR